MKSKLAKRVNDAKFVSVLCDGSMDVAVRENEVVCCLYFDPLPPNSDSVKFHLSFLGVKHIKGGDHLSIAKAIEESFEEIELDKSSDQKLIGFCSDGASVNRGWKESIMTVLREKSPWMLFLCCVAHRLELGLEDALSSTSFKDVDESPPKNFVS